MTNDKTIEQKIIVRDMSDKISNILTLYYYCNNIKTRKFITENVIMY